MSKLRNSQAFTFINVVKSSLKTPTADILMVFEVLSPQIRIICLSFLLKLVHSD